MGIIGINLLYNLVASNKNWINLLDLKFRFSINGQFKSILIFTIIFIFIEYMLKHQAYI